MGSSEASEEGSEACSSSRQQEWRVLQNELHGAESDEEALQASDVRHSSREADVVEHLLSLNVSKSGSDAVSESERSRLYASW